MSKNDELVRRWDVMNVAARYNSGRGAGSATARAIIAALDALPAVQPAVPATPGARWREEGKDDPHGNRYDCERADLAKGKLTDDELANRVFAANRGDLDLIVWQDAAKDRIRWLSRSLYKALGLQTFQSRVQAWMLTCFGEKISSDRLERGDRLLEEVFELLQSGNYPRERVAALEQYVWSRDIGNPAQEVGGVMTTLASYCLAHGLDMHNAAENELARVWTMVEKIRAKQAAKPKGSALPQVVRAPAPEVADPRVKELQLAMVLLMQRVKEVGVLDQMPSAYGACSAALAKLEGKA